MSSSGLRFEVVMGSVLPGGDPLPQPEWERYAGLSPELLASLPADVRLVASAVMVAARTATGRVDAAVELGSKEIQRVSATGVIDTARAGAGLLLLAVAEAYATAGATIETTRYAKLALRSDDLDPAIRYRASGLLAVGRALNGEYAAAIVAVVAAEELREERGWAPSHADFPLMLAQVLIASAALDAGELTRLSNAFRQLGNGSPIWTSTATATLAMAHLCRGELGEALALTRRVLQGTGQEEMLAMIRGFTLGIRADLLLLRGDAGQTLSLLQDEPSPIGHSLCFNMQRSAAFLQLGRDRDALRVTDECVKMGSRHCLRTIPPLLLRRAVASERLGAHDAADEEFAEAFHLLHESGSYTPLLTVPKPETIALLRRFASAAPEAMRPAIADLAARVTAVPGQAHVRPALPALTGREEVLARSLSGKVTNAELAAQLGVSLNTVKVHLRNLYAKLGVSGRAEALAALDAAGFYDIPSTRT
ncbi:hypothetical protein GCM10010988_28820 [Cnuibacter physcomitrellae]|nr:LuxR C-terminal-related transcriptional regulator [Cnuibacter physcomitrellae]GGI40386.1 hypothetical protein GCM10010988_28820 [Cnuibacter physcomitrellae]